MKSWRIPLSVACLILGILIATQFKVQQHSGMFLSEYRSPDLIRLVRDAQLQNTELENQISDMRSRLAAYEMGEKGKTEVSQDMLKELQKDRLEAGVVPVKGPGVEVMLNDSRRPPKPGEDDYFYLVHDVDLIQLENELWSAGAEAISVNDQRLVAGSSIRCVGPTILVNTFRLSPPYRVKAVGDPDTLATALKMRGGFMDAMGISLAHGVSVQIAKRNDLELPAFGGVMVFKYATPDLKE